MSFFGNTANVRVQKGISGSNTAINGDDDIRGLHALNNGHENPSLILAHFPVYLQSCFYTEGRTKEEFLRMRERSVVHAGK